MNGIHNLSTGLRKKIRMRGIKINCLLGQIFEEILTDLHVLKSPESENYIFKDLRACVCVNLLSA